MAMKGGLRGVACLLVLCLTLFTLPSFASRADAYETVAARAHCPDKRNPSGPVDKCDHSRCCFLRHVEGQRDLAPDIATPVIVDFACPTRTHPRRVASATQIFADKRGLLLTGWSSRAPPFFA